MDCETTGERVGWHEVVEIGIVVFDHFLRLTGDTFSTLVRPLYPWRCDQIAMGVHGISMDELADAPLPSRAADRLDRWFSELPLPSSRPLIPIAHNWVVEHGHLSSLLGPKLLHQIFHPVARDTMIIAATINDKIERTGNDRPFPRVRLENLCQQFDISASPTHRAPDDALATGLLYRELLDWKKWSFESCAGYQPSCLP